MVTDNAAPPLCGCDLQPPAFRCFVKKLLIASPGAGPLAGGPVGLGDGDPALALGQPCRPVVLAVPVGQFAAQLVGAAEPGRIQGAGVEGGANRAAGLALVPAIAEPALPGQV